MSGPKLTEYMQMTWQPDKYPNQRFKLRWAGRSACRTVQTMYTERADWELGSGKRANKIRCVCALRQQIDLFYIYFFGGRDAEVSCDEPYATAVEA